MSYGNNNTTEDERSEIRAHESFLIKLAIKAAALTLMVIIATIASCNMHGNMYEPDVEVEQTKQVQHRYAAEAKATEASAVIEKQRLDALERLIEQGTDPQAARCAILGPTEDRDQTQICRSLAGLDGKTSTTQ